MPVGRNHRRSSSRQPTFFWQGTLILLPAVLLSVVGLHSLKQDRALAEHEAIEQAKGLASALGNRLSQGVLKPPPPPDVSVFGLAAAGRLDSEEDPVVRAWRLRPGALAFLAGSDGTLLCPMPRAALPPPEPFDAGELDELARTCWESLNDALLTGQAVSRHSQLLEDLRQANPPPRVVALAEYRAGVACERADDLPDARELFRAVATSDRSIRAENGFPLLLFARVHLLQVEFAVSAPSRTKTLAELCSFAVASPTPLTEHALRWASNLDADLAKRWSSVLALHERCRKLAALSRSAGAFGPIDLDNERYLTFAEPCGDDRWITALPLSLVQSDCAALVKSSGVPEYFAVALGVAGQPLFPLIAPKGDAQLLTANPSEIALANGAVPLSIRISLGDPAKFYAAQRARSLRFALLIALSGGAVVIGFFTARRAFLRQQRLNEMKTNFVSSVSHELRAPIASVRLMAQELETDPTPETLQSYLKFIVQESLRLSAVIENVLDFSRREQGRDRLVFENTDLARLVGETVTLMERYAEGKALRLELETTGDPHDVNADGAALQRLLVNLLDNAIKHSPPAATIRIGLEFQPLRTFLWVEDHGPGIPREEQKLIFERFYRIGSELRRDTQGVGLGLSIVKYIAEAHGGAIHVQSEPGSGSRFTLDLPHAPAPATLLP